jgi:hypothetical protein
MGSVLMGSAWGEVVEAGACKNEPATERTRSVTIGDEAGAGKIELAEGICPPTAAASVLHSVMVWGRNHRREACLGRGRWGRRSVGGVIP